VGFVRCWVGSTKKGTIRGGGPAIGKKERNCVWGVLAVAGLVAWGRSGEREGGHPRTGGQGDRNALSRSHLTRPLGRKKSKVFLGTGGCTRWMVLGEWVSGEGKKLAQKKKKGKREGKQDTKGEGKTIHATTQEKEEVIRGDPEKGGGVKKEGSPRKQPGRQGCGTKSGAPLNQPIEPEARPQGKKKVSPRTEKNMKWEKKTTSNPLLPRITGGMLKGGTRRGKGGGKETAEVK